MEFYKYQGAGNDFIMIDNRSNFFPYTPGSKEKNQLVKKLCNQQFGIGADGLILLENHERDDFKMVFFNQDGSSDRMCGNGGRCIVAFAKYLGLNEDSFSFINDNKLYFAIIENNLIKIKMPDVKRIAVVDDNAYLLDTGTLHYVQFRQNVNDAENWTVEKAGYDIRHKPEYGDDGTNVNFVAVIDSKNNRLRIRTFERGVEKVTLACGTGAVASAICYFHKYFADKNTSTHQHIDLTTDGDELQVDFEYSPFLLYTNIWLTGPAEMVYRGEIDTNCLKERPIVSLIPELFL